MKKIFKNLFAAIFVAVCSLCFVACGATDDNKNGDAALTKLRTETATKLADNVDLSTGYTIKLELEFNKGQCGNPENIVEGDSPEYLYTRFKADGYYRNPTKTLGGIELYLESETHILDDDDGIYTEVNFNKTYIKNGIMYNQEANYNTNPEDDHTYDCFDEDVEGFVTAVNPVPSVITYEDKWSSEYLLELGCTQYLNKSFRSYSLDDIIGTSREDVTDFIIKLLTKNSTVNVTDTEVKVEYNKDYTAMINGVIDAVKGAITPIDPEAEVLGYESIETTVNKILKAFESKKTLDSILTDLQNKIFTDTATVSSLINYIDNEYLSNYNLTTEKVVNTVFDILDFYNGVEFDTENLLAELPFDFDMVDEKTEEPLSKYDCIMNTVMGVDESENPILLKDMKIKDIYYMLIQIITKVPREQIEDSTEDDEIYSLKYSNFISMVKEMTKNMSIIELISSIDGKDEPEVPVKMNLFGEIMNILLSAKAECVNIELNFYADEEYNINKIDGEMICRILNNDPDVDQRYLFNLNGSLSIEIAPITETNAVDEPEMDNICICFGEDQDVIDTTKDCTVDLAIGDNDFYAGDLKVSVYYGENGDSRTVSTISAILNESEDKILVTIEDKNYDTKKENFFVITYDITNEQLIVSDEMLTAYFTDATEVDYTSIKISFCYNETENTPIIYTDKQIGLESGGITSWSYDYISFYKVETSEPDLLLD